MYLSEKVSGFNLTRIVAGLLAAGYGVGMALWLFLEFTPSATRVLLAVTLACGAGLLVGATVTIALSSDRRASLWSWAWVPVLLVAPVPCLFGATRAVYVLLALLAWVLLVRTVASGHRLGFAFATSVGIALTAAVAMAFYERQNTTSGAINDVGDAFLWAATTVLRAPSYGDLQPVTASGKLLGIAVIASGVLFASIMVSALTGWIIGSGTAAKDREAIEATVRSVLAESGDLPAREGRGPRKGRERVGDAVEEDLFRELAHTRRVDLWLDVERILGSHFPSWWRPRATVATELVDALGDIDGRAVWRELGGGDVAPQIFCVLQGGARRVRTEISSTRDGCPMRLIRTQAGAADFISVVANDGDIVVSSDPELVELDGVEGVRVVTPKEFRHALASAEQPGV